MPRNWLKPILTWWWRKRCSPEQPATSARPVQLALEEAADPGSDRIILADGVARTLFEEYANHRRSLRGEEEIGWVLLGLRQGKQSFALAALPAGTQREAGVAHVLFNRDAQELASRILRQHDKRLSIIGVVHTHPGSLRHPSEGDFQGDCLWVSQLRGGEGIFGIGTADAYGNEGTDSPHGHRQYFGGLCFSWYALAQGDSNYRPLAVQVAIGSDLAQPLHAIWHLLEAHAKPLNRLCRQLARVQFEIHAGEPEKLLALKIPLAQPAEQLRLLLSESEARYYWDRQGELIALDVNEPQVDRAVYLILADLAKELAAAPREPQTLVES